MVRSSVPFLAPLAIAAALAQTGPRPGPGLALGPQDDRAARDLLQDRPLLLAQPTTSAERIVVPRLVGRQTEEALEELAALGLELEIVTTTPSDRRSGTILEQHPVVGSRAPPGFGVNAVVAGREDQPSLTRLQVIVPGVVGRQVDRAGQELERAGLGFEVLGSRPADGPPNTVLEQHPDAGRPARRGLRVNVIVSADRERPERIEVPRLLDRSIQEAERAVASLPLELGVVGERPDAAPADTVIEQQPAPGTEVDPGAVVEVVLSSGVPRVEVQVEVPRLVDRQIGDARVLVTRLSLGLREAGERPDVAAVGRVIEQAPPPGTLVDLGTVVEVVLSSGPPIVVEPIPVPRLIGRQIGDARVLVARLSLDLREAGERPDVAAAGSVIEQAPPPGTLVDPGAVIEVVLSSGPAPLPGAPVVVPDLLGLTEGEARLAVERLGLLLAIGERRADERRAGTVLAQSPVAGSRVAGGAPVRVAISIGRPPGRGWFLILAGVMVVAVTALLIRLVRPRRPPASDLEPPSPSYRVTIKPRPDLREIEEPRPAGPETVPGIRLRVEPDPGRQSLEVDGPLIVEERRTRD